MKGWQLAVASVLVSQILAERPRAETDGTWTTHLYMNNVRRIAVAADGVWCATTGGALFFDFASSEFARWNRSSGGLASDSLVDVDILTDGQVAFATQGAGISIYQPASGVWFTYTSLIWPLAGDEVRFVSEDAPWRIIGSNGGVLVQAEGQTRLTCEYQVDPCGLPSWDVTAGVHYQGHFWFGTVSGETGPGAIGRLNPNLGSWNTIATPGDVVDLVKWRESLYCVTDQGVFSWNGTGWDDRNAGLDDLDVDVQQLHAGSQRLLAAAWGPDGGPFYWDEAASRWERLAGAHLRGCCTVAEGADGIVWAGARAGWSDGVPFLQEDEDGLWELVGETWVQHRQDGPHAVADYRGLTVDDAGRVWAVSAGKFPRGWRLERFEGGQWTFYNNTSAPLSRGWGWHVRMLEDRMWLGHCCCTDVTGGCYLDDWLLGSATATAYDSLMNIFCSAIDDRGNLWFGSSREDPEEYPETLKGIFHYEVGSDAWTHYDLETTGGRMLANAVSALAARGDTLWIGYATQGVQRVLLDAQGHLPIEDAAAWRAYSTTDGLAGNRIAAIQTRPGEAWIATDNGISLRDGAIWRIFRESGSQLPGGQIKDLALTDDGAAWAVVAGVGVTRIARSATGTWSVFETFTPPDLVSSTPRHIERGPQGRDVWVATAEGLSHFTPSPTQSVVKLSGLDVYPNPFNPGCGAACPDGDNGVKFKALPGRAREGVVVDVAGNIVARFADVWEEDCFWDGRDLGGARVAPGLYIVRASTPQGWLTGRIAVLDLPCE